MAASSRKTRSIIFFIAVNLLSVICLIWALHGMNFARFFSKVAHLQWGWVAVAVISNVLSYLVQGWRWSMVLAPVTPVPVWKSVQAIYVGLYANEVLPLRSGEIIRCYLQARWSELPLSVTLASALIERIFDGIWLIVALAVTLEMVHLPRVIKNAGLFVSALVLVCGVLLAVAMYWKEQTLDALVKSRRLRWLHVLIKDLHLIGHSRYLYFAFALSLPFLVLQVLPIYAMLRAYRDLPGFGFVAALTLAVALRLNSVLPQAPGNIGTFQWAAILGLRVFRVKDIVAKDFSFILWAVLTLPLFVLGFIAVALTGTNIFDIHRGAKKSMNERSKVPERRHKDRVA